MNKLLILCLILLSYYTQAQIYTTKEERMHQHKPDTPILTLSLGGVIGNHIGVPISASYVFHHTYAIGLEFSGSRSYIKGAYARDKLYSFGLSGYYILNTYQKQVRFLLGGSINNEYWKYPVNETIDYYWPFANNIEWEHITYFTLNFSPAVDIALEKWLGIRIRPEYVWAPINSRFQLNVSLIFGNVKDYRKK